MTSNTHIMRKALRGGAALQALALLGAGLTTSAILATPAAAQDYTNVIASGRVQGTNGQPITGATVVMRSDNQGFERTVITDGSGTFRVPQIPAGNYSVTITADGFDTYTETGISISLNASSNQFTLSSAGAASSGDIVVTAGRVQVVDFERTTTGQVINIGELSTRVPVGRDLTSVILLAPGTTQGDAAFGNLPNLRGASVAENAYYINGLNISMFRQGLAPVAVPFDFYETIDIKTGGYQAEFGRATGGIIVATTKSGSNEFHGGVTFNWEPDDLQDDAKNTLFADNDNDFRSRTDAVFQLSGPIIKDRLFFYGIYNARDVKTGDGSTTAVVPNAAAFPNFTVTGNNYVINRDKSPFYGGKIDAIPFDGQRLEFTYFDSSSVFDQQIFGQTGTASVACTDARRYCASNNQLGTFSNRSFLRRGGENYVGRYTGQFTDWLTLSAAYGKNKQRNTTEVADTTLPSIIDARPGRGNAQLGNAIGNSAFDFDEREFYRGDIDLFFNLFGSHHIRGGYDRENLSSDSSTRANGDYQISINTATAETNTVFNIPVGTEFVLSRFFLNGGQFQSRNESYYLQDSWSLFSNRLNLQLGIRNDRFQNSNADGVVFYNSGDQWGPRIGVVLDPFGDNKTKVFGNFGRYFLPVAGNTNIRLAGAELDYDRYNAFGGLGADGRPVIGAPILIRNGRACPDINTAACFIRSDGVAADTSSTVAGNLNPQSIDEYILGAEHRFTSRIKASLTYTRSRLNDALEDSAVDPAIRAFCSTSSTVNAAQRAFCLDNWSGTHQYVLINPGRDSVVTLSEVLPGETMRRTITLSAEDLKYPQAERQYDSVTFQADREFDGVWSLSGSYTYTRLRGNYEGGVKSDNGQTDTGLTTDFDLPGLAIGNFGPSPNEREHNFKLFGSFAVTDWFTFGANTQVTSPRKFGCIGLTPAAIDADANAFYGANGRFCRTNADGSIQTNPFAGTAGQPALGALTQVDRGASFESDWLYNTNLDFIFKVPVDSFDAQFRVSVFNVFNQQQQLDFVELGTTGTGVPRADYGQVNQYQTPRSIRLQFGVNF